jgi:MOSC domain-containing protein YiiM
MKLLSVNLGNAKAADYAGASSGTTGIDKRPVEGPVAVVAPGPEREGASGLIGDSVCNLRHHGGTDQAVYAFAREDLDDWEKELGRELPSGVFGENLTTTGIDVNSALIGERWQIGRDVVLEVCAARIPCRTFQGWMGEKAWMKRFTQAATPGAYLRVIEPGEIRAGDPVEIMYRPDHQVTVAFLFRALMTERNLMPRILAAGKALHPEATRSAREWVSKYGS